MNIAAAGLLAALSLAYWPSNLADWARPWIAVPKLTAFTAPAAAARAQTLFAAAALVFLFWSSGRRLARALGVPSASRLESAVEAFALGALFWGQLFLLLGLAGLLHAFFLRMLLAAGLAAGLAECVRRRPSFSVLRDELAQAGLPWLTLLGLHLLIIAPYAFLPETYFDSLEYHLGLPHLYLLRGCISPVADNAFSGVPSLGSMLFAWALVLDPAGRAAHLLNFLLLPATCLVLLALARRVGTPRAGGPAALFFALAPCVVAAAHKTGAETSWAFFQTTSFCAILSASSASGAGAWIAVGLLVGATMSTKYLAWGLPAAALAAAWAGEKRPTRRDAALAAAACAIVLSPWLIKNLVFYGNPLYPFFHEFLHPRAEILPGWRYVSAGASIPWGAGFSAGIRAWFKAPLASLRYEADYEHFASPVLLGLLPAGFWLASKRRALTPLLAFALAAWLPLSLVTDLPRYLIPVYPAFALIAALALECNSRLLNGLVFIASLAAAVATWTGGLPRSHLPVFTGQRTESDFLAHSNEYYYPNPLYAASRWLDANAPARARVLVFGDARGFQIGRDHLLSTPQQPSILERWANASANGADLHARFARKGVDYILVNHAEIARQNQSLAFHPAGKRSLDQFWARYTLKVFEVGPEAASYSPSTLDRWVVVYRVLGEEEAARPHPSDDLFAAYKTSN